MKYKLINNTTGEEQLCEKITIQGFDYYLGGVVTDTHWQYLPSIVGFVA